VWGSKPASSWLCENLRLETRPHATLAPVPRSAVKTERPPHLRVVGTAPERALSDEEIVVGIERGDPEAAELLYDRFGGVVAATLLRVLGRRDVDHDDLVQTAFEQLFVSLARGRFGRACSLKSWAVSITTNTALNALRKRRTERRYVEPEHESHSFQIAAHTGDPERATQVAWLREELAKLAPQTAEVIVLFEVMGCELTEIASVTGLSVAAAQSRLVRGRAELRSRLDARAARGHS
jgi:RNA polymerase sigma-70 factor (ECF subfamily)